MKKIILAVLTAMTLTLSSCSPVQPLEEEQHNTDSLSIETTGKEAPAPETAEITSATEEIETAAPETEAEAETEPAETEPVETKAAETKAPASTGKKYLELKRTEYGNDGKVLSSYEYEYDDAGRILKEHSFSEFTGKTETMVYEYDEKGQNTKRYDDSSNYYILYEYDKSGNITKRSTFYGSERSYYDIYKYNNKNQLISRTDYDGGGGLLFETDYEYNSSGQEIKAVEYNFPSLSRKEEWVTTIKKYDSMGRLEKTISEIGGDSMFISTYEYDENGNVKQMSCTDRTGGQISSRVVYEYIELN